MLDVVVQPPVKAASKYVFQCSMRVRPSRLERLGRRLPRRPVPPRTRLKFGYRSVGFDIRHHEVWDGFYPLFFLTRLSSPALGLEHPVMRIRFTYPIARPLRDFFVRRAHDHGIELEIVTRLCDVADDRPTEGHVLAFGGGKDSRMILGLLRETGVEPTVVTTRGGHAADIDGRLEVRPVYQTLSDRVMASLMHGGTDLYYGGGLGESQLVDPWHRYYDLAAARPRAELAALLAELGMPTRLSLIHI